MRYKVNESWQASYDDPIRLRAGEAVVASGRQEHWDGYLWLWARAADGREGWVPDTLLDCATGDCRTRRDYSAVELTCRAGQVLEGGEEMHGWVWCRAADGQAGWVPRRHLDRFDTKSA
ncbi:MAG: hypothetical protein JJT95_14035 [Pararhodobacter sp.]|nr:hypothetical protein [Pararhodobacter sp.]